MGTGQRKPLIVAAALAAFCLTAASASACRFWCAVGEKVYEGTVIDEMLYFPRSLKNLGREYTDGWAVGYMERGEPIIFRGIKSSFKDSHFDRNVKDVAMMEAPIVFGHLRRASSGCVEGVPNPHPFERVHNGKTWIFGHNGGVAKELMAELITPEYLRQHPPKVCDDNPPHSWIDSEMLFIYFLKKIDDNFGETEKGIEEALKEIYARTEEGSRYLNFFLSDGQTVWAFRKGNSLFYKYNPVDKTAFVSSSVPARRKGRWRVLPEDVLVVMKPEDPLRFVEFDF